MKTALVTARPGKKIRLSKIDPDEHAGVDKDAALKHLAKMREKLCELQYALYAEHQRSLLIVFQAMDTGGKDSSVISLCSGLNPEGVVVTSFKAPTSHELDHDFLWRIHQVAPGKGMIAIWNRSHYEDVLVARVHKLVAKDVWEARYRQINDFERLLTENGTTILKFMLHISKDEQKQRLRDRLDTPKKRWKFNVNDLKERLLWDDYQEAYEDAINCCTSEEAPWHVVPANRKWARNLAIGEAVVENLKKMNPRYPKLPFDPKTVTID